MGSCDISFPQPTILGDGLGHQETMTPESQMLHGAYTATAH